MKLMTEQALLLAAAAVSFATAYGMDPKTSGILLAGLNIGLAIAAGL